MMESDDSGTSTDPDLPPDLSRLGEFGLIRRIRRAAQSTDPRVLKGIGDDAAVFTAADKTLATTDLLIENVHFRMDKTTPRLLGRKALSVNLSDIAAMAATPKFVLLGLAAPPDFSADTLDAIIAGFTERAKEAGVTLVGGDVCRSELLVLAVTVIGEVSGQGPVYRSGAGPDDLIFVTGTVGGSALGLLRLNELASPITEEAIMQDILNESIMMHLDPPARLSFGKKAAGIAASMIDLSDGIMSDLQRILEESSVPGAVIKADRIPLSSSFREHFQVKAGLSEEALSLAFAGGEDYELLLTAPAGAESGLMQIGDALDLPITRIGRISRETGIILEDESGEEIPLPAPGFNHFGGSGKNG